VKPYRIEALAAELEAVQAARRVHRRTGGGSKPH
jgi:hypothetical protein